jgi:ElaB/YqjD/DUF883 family membrane-anchored ribosome-binding protein
MSTQPDRTIEEIKERAEQSLEVLKAEVVDVAKLVDERARKSPWKFVSFAALLAVIFGFLLGRQTKR